MGILQKKTSYLVYGYHEKSHQSNSIVYIEMCGQLSAGATTMQVLLPVHAAGHPLQNPNAETTKSKTR